MKMREIKVTVRETAGKREMTMYAGKVRSQWCECEQPEFAVYPEDDACPCGLRKHHVHCVCGGVMQVG